MNRKDRITSACVAIILFCAGTASAQTFGFAEAVENVGPGKVNWTTNEVFAIGLGAPPSRAANPGQARAMAERAAHVVALRNLLETVKGIRVDSETVVENFIVSSDVIRTRVNGIVKGARVVKKRYLSDGSVEMLVAMPIKGAFLNAVVPETFGKELPSPPAPAVPTAPDKRQDADSPALMKPVPPAALEPEKNAEPLPPPSPAPPAPQEPEKRAEPLPPLQPAPPMQKVEPPPAPAGSAGGTLAFKGGTATGVVIDGRGLGLRPALLPRVMDPDGREIYVGQVVTRTNAVEQGVAGYAKDVTAAANNFRVTDNPAVIKAVQAAGASRTDVVIAQADAQSLRGLGEKGDFLQNCRVIIVY